MTPYRVTSVHIHLCADLPFCYCALVYRGTTKLNKLFFFPGIRLWLLDRIMARIIMFTYFLPFLLLQSTPSTPLPLYTGTVYVLIPDVHRSGGPACLHSLHAQLNQLTITSYMFNLLPQYTTPHSRPIPLPLLSNVDQPLTSMPQVLATKPLVIDYLINHLTPHDWIVVPTHWIDSDYFTQKDMERFSNTGARTLVYLLGVAYPWDFTTPSNNNPGLVVGFKLQEITQGFASVLPLSNYIATYYQLPHKHIVALAPLERIYYIMHQEYMKLSMAEQRHRKKRILVDADLTGDLYIPTDLLDKYEFVLLEGKNIKELIDLYQTAVIIIDLHFNGPERTVWEAILFDCYPIVAHQGNGGDDIDIPIPSQVRPVSVFTFLCTSKCTSNTFAPTVATFPPHVCHTFANVCHTFTTVQSGRSGCRSQSDGNLGFVCCGAGNLKEKRNGPQCIGARVFIFQTKSLVHAQCLSRIIEINV